MLNFPTGRFDQGSDVQPTGSLDLGIEVSGGKSVAKRQFHAGALKIIRPHYLDDSGQVYYIMVNPGGGYLGGDSYEIGVAVEPDASVLLTDQSATKVYRTPGSFVTQQMRFEVARDGVLEYVPDQLILYRDADYRQQVTVELEESSTLFMSDIVTPGWSPDGTQFRYKEAHLRTEIRMGGAPVLLDNLRINPVEDAATRQAPTFLGDNTHFATAICIAPGIDEDMIAEIREAIRDIPGVESSITECDVPGYVLRAVGTRTEELMATVQAAANVARRTLRGQGPLHLRQY